MTSRVVVITGAARGIGAATVDLFRAEGWYAVGVDKEADTETSADRFVAADVVDERSVIAAFEGLADLGGIDALVNNAAVSLSGSLTATTAAEWDEVMAVNVRAAFLATRAVNPLMQGRGGAIVNVGSVHALATTAGVAAYAASKGALVAFTRASAMDLAHDGIRVNAVLPGAIDTPMLRRGADDDGRIRSIAARTPLGRVGEAREVAQAILFLADAQRSSFITGSALVVDGGALTRLGTE